MEIAMRGEGKFYSTLRNLETKNKTNTHTNI